MPPLQAGHARRGAVDTPTEHVGYRPGFELLPQIRSKALDGDFRPSFWMDLVARTQPNLLSPASAFPRKAKSVPAVRPGR